MSVAAAAAEQRIVVGLVGQVTKEKCRGREEARRRTFAWDFARILKANSAFKEIIAATGFDVGTVLEQPADLGIHGRVLALLCLRPGTHWGCPLTQWSSEERIWWGCLQRSSDSFPCKSQALRSPKSAWMLTMVWSSAHPAAP